jgi:hypothetical protein
LPGIDQVTGNEPVESVCGVTFKPGFAGAESEAVTPAIHIGKDTLAAEAVEFVG